MTLKEIAQHVSIRCSIAFDSVEFEVKGGKASFIKAHPEHDAKCCGVDGHVETIDAKWLTDRGLVVDGFDTSEKAGSHIVECK